MGASLHEVYVVIYQIRMVAGLRKWLKRSNCCLELVLLGGADGAPTNIFQVVDKSASVEPFKALSPLGRKAGFL
jgi:hypothetical protein